MKRENKCDKKKMGEQAQVLQVLQENFLNVLQEKDVKTRSGVTSVTRKFSICVTRKRCENKLGVTSVTRKFCECVTRKRCEDKLRCYKCNKKIFRMCYKKKM